MLLIFLGVLMVISAGLMFIGGYLNSEEREKRIGYIVGGVLALGLAGFSIVEGIDEIVDFWDEDTSPDYETTYIDENGNGNLDPGEWNYTTDEDGNVVDIDDNLNNFE